jgi:hypothetical protein
MPNGSYIGQLDAFFSGGPTYLHDYEYVPGYGTLPADANYSMNPDPNTTISDWTYRIFEGFTVPANTPITVYTLSFTDATYSTPFYLTKLTFNCTTAAILSLYNGPTISLSPATLPDGTLGAAYNQVVTASGGISPYTYAMSTGALPNGLSLDGNTGAISGTPTASGSFPFTVTATDQLGLQASRAYTVTINGSGDAFAPVSGDTPTPTQTSPVKMAQITLANMTCQQFSSNSAATLSELDYSVVSGKASSIVPGLFTYWVKVKATTTNTAVTIIQNQDGSYPHFFNSASGSAVYTKGCVTVRGATITTTTKQVAGVSFGVTTVTFRANVGNTYIIGIKYASVGAQGFSPVPRVNPMNYIFATTGVGDSTQSLAFRNTTTSGAPAPQGAPTFVPSRGQ